jgi:Trk K+ transport system NAD-binding subunit
MGTFLAMTNNGEVNFVLAQRAAEEFSPPRVLAVFPRKPQPNSSPSHKVSQAFATELVIKTWNEYLNDGRVKLGTTTLNDSEFTKQQERIQEKIKTGDLIPLLVEREDRLQVMPASQEWLVGDRIIYLLHDPRPNLLKRLSGGSQSTRLSLETLPEVEELPLEKLSQLFSGDAPKK